MVDISSLLPPLLPMLLKNASVFWLSSRVFRDVLEGEERERGRDI
jgi:hypothetical protein